MASAAAAPAALPAPAPTIVIHQHFETVAREPAVAFMLDVSGPAYGTVNRNAKGDATDVNGFNMSFGYSWKRYISRVANPVSVYRTVGTIGGIVPHFEFGVDYKHVTSTANPQDPRSRTEAVIGMGLSYGLVPKFHGGFYS